MLIVGIDDLPQAQALTLKTKYPEENTITFFYAHLSKIIVDNNKPVKAGDIIGKSGCTGNASNMKSIQSGSHLHFEVRKTNAACGKGVENRIDPLPFINNCTNITQLRDET